MKLELDNSIEIKSDENGPEGLSILVYKDGILRSEIKAYSMSSIDCDKFIFDIVDNLSIVEELTESLRNLGY